MAVTSVFFPRTNARDIHLLPGMVSPRLDHLLAINDTAGVVRADTPPAGVTTHFQAVFSGTPSAHGVTYNDATREIEIASAFPAGPRLRSFVALCGCSEGMQLFSMQLRIHVHESIADMWVTPRRRMASRNSGVSRVERTTPTSGRVSRIAQRVWTKARSSTGSFGS